MRLLTLLLLLPFCGFAQTTYKASKAKIRPGRDTTKVDLVLTVNRAQDSLIITNNKVASYRQGFAMNNVRIDRAKKVVSIYDLYIKDTVRIFIR